jgi:putative transposase
LRLGETADFRRYATHAGRQVEWPRFDLIAKPNHAWCADITSIPMERGFVYLFAVMDWATRRILAWRHIEQPM